jgi:hypothetical protein
MHRSLYLDVVWANSSRDTLITLIAALCPPQSHNSNVEIKPRGFIFCLGQRQEQGQQAILKLLTLTAKLPSS